MDVAVIVGLVPLWADDTMTKNQSWVIRRPLNRRWLIFFHGPGVVLSL